LYRTEVFIHSVNLHSKDQSRGLRPTHVWRRRRRRRWWWW